MVQEWVGTYLSIDSDGKVTEKEATKVGTPQIWTKGIENAKYFTLSTPSYSKVLTVLSDGQLMMKGMKHNRVFFI